MNRNLFLVLIICLFGCKSKNNDVPQITIDRLKSIDTNWYVIQEKPGRTTYKNQKWLMYFIHWRELTDDNRHISQEYAKEVLMNLWKMPFNPSDLAGACSVNGHKAYFAEATLRNAVKTRFVVWNCENTGRQFIADCNINLLMKTPLELFRLQYEDITSYFGCHKSENLPVNKDLKQLFDYKNLNIRFYLPENWKSKEFLLAKDSSKNIPGYYPDGVTEKKGSIWNLLTDSEKLIDIAWKGGNEELSEELMLKMLKDIESDTLIEMMDTIEYISVYKNFNFENVTLEKDMLKGKGTFYIEQNVPAYNSIETTKYKQNVFMWKENDSVYLMLASMIAYDELWRQPIDLTPSDEIFGTFVKEITNVMD